MQIAMARVDDAPVCYYIEKIHMLWSSGAYATVNTSVARMAGVVSDLLERLDTELSDDDMVCTFQVFDLLGWQLPDIHEARTQRLNTHLTSLVCALGQYGNTTTNAVQHTLPVALASREVTVASLILAGVTADAIFVLAGVVVYQAVANHDGWGEILYSNGKRTMRVLPKVIRWYHAAPLETPDDGRKFGQVAALSHEHAGSNTTDTMMVGRCSRASGTGSSCDCAKGKYCTTRAVPN